MPEVCEVALTAEILHNRLKGKNMLSFNFIDGRYGVGRTKPVGYQLFKKSLPIKIKKVDSRGKFMWFDLVDSDDMHWYIWNTYGLTGLWSFNELPFTKAKMTFENSNTILYYIDIRNFGTFKFSQDQELLRKKLEILSPDFLKDDDFDITNITKYQQPIVSVLMDQKKVGSGIGNYLVAEILYHARISPHRKCNTLTKKEIKKLTHSIKYIIKLCYVNGGSEYMDNLDKEIKKYKRINYHPNIKINNKFMFHIYQQKMDPLGNPVKAEKIVKGRTIYWVPVLQK